VQQQQQSTSDIEKDETEENEEANNNGKKSYSDQDIKDMIRSFAIETRVLTKDIRTTGASPRVVQLSGERRNGKWQSHKKLPNYQYQTQQSLLYTLNQRCEQLKQKMSHIQSNNKRYNEETKVNV
jgi:dynactin 1